MTGEIEIHRTRKGRVLLDQPATPSGWKQIYSVWIFRQDGLQEQILETCDEGVAIAVLKDYRINR